MISDKQIIEALQQFIGNIVTKAIIAEVIDNADAETKGEIRIMFNELEYDARLRSIIDEKFNTVVYVPAEGSQVYCTPIDGDNFIVVAHSKVDKVIFIGDNIEYCINDVDKLFSVKNGESTLEISDKDIVFNGGKLGGLIKFNDLKSELDKTNSFVTTMKSAVSSGLKAVGASTAANGALGAQAFDNAMAGKQPGDYSNIEDDKVKH